MFGHDYIGPKSKILFRPRFTNRLNHPSSRPILAQQGKSILARVGHEVGMPRHVVGSLAFAVRRLASHIHSLVHMLYQLRATAVSAVWSGSRFPHG